MTNVALPTEMLPQPPRSARHSLTVVTSLDQLAEVAEAYKGFEAFSFDFETKGEKRNDPRHAIPFWISLAGPGRSECIPFGHPLGRVTGHQWSKLKKNGEPYANAKQLPVVGPPPRQLSTEAVFEALEPVLFGAGLKIGHNLKFDLEVAARYYGTVPPPAYWDTQIAAFLIDETHLGGYPYALGNCVKREFRFEYDKSLGRIGVDKFPLNEAAQYSRLDAKYTWLLYQRYRQQIEEMGFSELMGLEMDVLQCVVWMEEAGVAVDVAGLEDLAAKVAAQKDEVYARISRAAGEGWPDGEINLNANRQVAKLVFGIRGHQPRVRTEKMGEPAVSAEAFRHCMRDAVVKDILHWQELQKLHATYLLNMIARIHNGRLHADFDQRGARTGRFSCVAADTLIEMPRDLVEYPGGVPISEIRAGDWVYAYDWHRELVLKRVKWVGQTGVRETVVVTVENSEGHRMTLRLTPDHLVRLRNGDWRPAGSLMHQWGQPHRSDGPRVMTMARRRIDDGYIKFFPHAVAKGNGPTGGGKSREHRWIVEQITGKKVSTKADVHHRDGNRANNHPSNLEKLTVVEHRGKRHIHPAWGEKQPLPDLYCGPTDYRVVSVSPGLVEPVWDMEVEEAHNFIANGVCVHNCRTPNLQNVPVRRSKEIRDLFIAPPGYKLIVADYSQIELRVLAHLTRDPMLIKAYQDGLNLHTITGCRAYHVKEEDLTKEQYSRAKNCNFCVPMDTQALTPQGWVTHDRLQPGDQVLGYEDGVLVWTTVRAKHYFDDADLVEIRGNNFRATTTEGHRWLAQVRRPNREVFTTTGTLTGEHCLILSAPATIGGELDLTGNEAAVIAWLLCDGSIIRSQPTGARQQAGGRKVKFQATVYQKKAAGIIELERVLTCLRYRRKERPTGIVEYHINPDDIRALWERAGIDKTGLEQFVMRLGPEVRQAFVDAAWYAEGWFNGGSKMLAQNDGPVLEALRLAIFLTGKRPTASSNGVYKGVTNWNLNFSSPRVTGQRLKRTMIGGPASVWCPETETGTWVMRQGDQIMLTGNSIAYGAQASTLVNRYGVPNEREAQALIDAFLGTYQKVDPWRRAVVRKCVATRITRAEAKSRGCRPVAPYVTTIMGRKRRLPDITSFDYKRRMAAERQAVNTRVQGSAGDILKVAMVQLYNRLHDSPCLLMLTVHDELVVQAPDELVEWASDEMRRSMENVPISLLVPLIADITVCTRWSEK